MRFRPTIALVLCAACATPSKPFEGHPVLADIRFEGNNSISKSELLSKIITAPTSGFFSKTARYYDADLFAIDQKRIIRWYNQKGFYQAKIVDVQEERDPEGRVTLVVKIDEGRRAMIRRMPYDGMDPLNGDERGDIDSALPIHPGDPFDEDGYEKAKQVLQQQLREHGFAEAKVDGRVEVNPEEGWADVFWKVAPGERFRFDQVVVTGNRAIAPEQIARATGINPGDLFRPSSLELAQQRIYNLGAFSGVRVTFEPRKDAPLAIVKVNVREAPFQTVRLGPGLQIEESRWEVPRLRTEYTNRDLLGGLRRLELTGTVGYAFVPTLLSSRSQDSGIAAKLTSQLVIPNVLLPGLDFVTRAEFDREFQPNYRYEEVAGRVGFVYRYGRHTLAPSLNFERYFDVSFSGDVGLTTLIAKAGAAGGLLSECGAGCTLTYPEIRYTYDARDNVFETTDGFYASASLQQTLKPGSFSYFRLDPEARFYRPVGRFAVFATRFQYGGMFAEAGSLTPFTQRFFGGGQNWQRGYAPLRQGPKVGAEPCTGIQDPSQRPAGCDAPYATVSVPVGGKSEIIVSAELRIRADALLNHLLIVPFVDASRVQDYPYNPWAGGLEIAPGLGLRYLTPFGPLRLDFGWVANPKPVTARGTVDPATGAVVIESVEVSPFCPKNRASCIHEQRWAIHISLGEAF